MRRPIVCLLLASWALDPSAARAAPPTPCTADALAPAVAGLADRLAASDEPAAWTAILAAAAALAEGDGFSPAERACAAYVAGSAAFFLSADRDAGRRHAATAVRWFGLAEALAPEAMAARQPRSRSGTAWQRLGEVPGWLRGRRPVAVAIPPGPAGTVRLSPADPAAWRAVCADCEARIDVPREAERAVSVSLRPGWYRVEHVGPCGATAAEAEVAGGLVPVPEPAVCTAQVRALDGEAPIADFTVRAGEAPIDAAAAPVGGPLTVEAAGYLPRAVTPDPLGGPLPVALERCPVILDVTARPAHARVDGAGPAPWGPRTIRATAPGHGPVSRAVDVPRPARCAGARHAVEIALPRAIGVLATDAEGRPVSVARLLVDGEPADPVGLARPPGRYAIEARHPTLGAATAAVEVPPCAAPDCPPVSAALKFPPPPSTGVRTGPLVAYITGGVLLTGGLLAGVSAWGTHNQILTYDSKSSAGEALDDLVARRDEQARAADVLLIGGGLSLLGGWLWSTFAEAD